MSQPIYKHFQLTFTQAWWQLSPDKQNALLEQNNRKLEELGIKTLVLCESSWANEAAQFWGVEVYPDIETVQKLAHFHVEIGWYRYYNGSTLLGTEFQA